jgi:hypothetical protein
MFTVPLLLQRTFKLLVPCNNSGHTPTANTDGAIGNCLQQPGQPPYGDLKATLRRLSVIYGPDALFSFDQFINLTILYPLITFRRLPCCSSTGINNRAAGRRTVVMVFASPSGQFYRDVTTPYRLSGLIHLDNFIMTRKLPSVNRDFANAVY